MQMKETKRFLFTFEIPKEINRFSNEMKIKKKKFKEIASR